MVSDSDVSSNFSHCLVNDCFAGLRILVTLLLDTLPMLGNVLLLCFFVFFIFGIIGVQLWAGLLRQRCYLEIPDNVSMNGLVLSHGSTDAYKSTAL
jgi:Ion transport protein